MEGFALEKFNKLKPSTIPMTQFHSHLSSESDQDTSTTATYLCILLQYILAEKNIHTFLTTMQDYIDGCAKQYNFESAIYLLSCLDL